MGDCGIEDTYDHGGGKRVVPRDIPMAGGNDRTVKWLEGVYARQEK